MLAIAFRRSASGVALLEEVSAHPSGSALGGRSRACAHEPPSGEHDAELHQFIETLIPYAARLFRRLAAWCCGHLASRLLRTPQRPCPAVGGSGWPSLDRSGGADFPSIRTCRDQRVGRVERQDDPG